jgi:hypothetical protein
LRKIRPSELTNDEHTTSAILPIRNYARLETDDHDAGERQHRYRDAAPADRLARNITDITRREGTLICVATATVAASSVR